MTNKSDRKTDDEAQSKRFIEAAKKAEADETEKGADKAFNRVSQKSKNSQDSLGRKK
jgi:hypothetical protein